MVSSYATVSERFLNVYPHGVPPGARLERYNGGNGYPQLYPRRSCVPPLSVDSFPNGLLEPTHLLGGLLARQRRVEEAARTLGVGFASCIKKRMSVASCIVMVSLLGEGVELLCQRRPNLLPVHACVPPWSTLLQALDTPEDAHVRLRRFGLSASKLLCASSTGGRIMERSVLDCTGAEVGTVRVALTAGGGTAGFIPSGGSSTGC